jgi:hypothetical protein
MDIAPGKILPIPCRHCGKMIAFTVAAGIHSLKCLACSGSTRLTVSWKMGEVRIATAPEEPVQISG